MDITMPNTLLKQAIKEEARKVGFHIVGVTTPDPPSHYAVYKTWLAHNYHAGMAWMATNRALARRANLRLILPECQSVLVLGMAYPPPASNPTDIQGTGRVASYAWGEDYHDLIPKALQAIVQFIETHVGAPVPNRWYTDTGPILERELAQRAGLGWIGKNTCLINPQLGSYFLLAEILLGIELAPDPPFSADRCGTCTRCLDHCPTACILPNRMIDANRCISYLTIEHKEAIPVELRERLGSWIFGCDICQQVCPWNQTSSFPRWHPGFSPRPGVRHPNLADELFLTPQAFNRKFKGNPVKRAKRRGYLRNVAVALGNQRNSSAIPALKLAINDPEPLVREHAAWALGKIGGKNSLQVLLAARANENTPTVLQEIQSALREMN